MHTRTQLALQSPTCAAPARALTRRSVCAGVALLGAAAVAPPCLAKSSSRTLLLNQLAHLVLVRRRIGRLEAVLAPTLSAAYAPAGGASPRVVVATQSKALFKELEFERNMEGAMAFLADVPQARTLGRDSLEFLASTVSFDGLASFDDPINEGMLARETTPAKLEYVRRAVAKSASSLDAFLGLFDATILEQARELADDSGIS